LSASSAKKVWVLTVKGTLLDTSHVALQPNYLLHFCDAMQVGISGHREHVLVSSGNDLHRGPEVKSPTWRNHACQLARLIQFCKVSSSIFLISIFSLYRPWSIDNSTCEGLQRM